MPYADIEQKRASMRDRYKERYDTEKGFAKKESKRKATWYEKNREKVIARVLARRAELNAAKRKAAAQAAKAAKAKPAKVKAKAKAR